MTERQHATSHHVDGMHRPLFLVNRPQRLCMPDQGMKRCCVEYTPSLRCGLP